MYICIYEPIVRQKIMSSNNPGCREYVNRNVRVCVPIYTYVFTYMYAYNLYIS